MWIFYDKHANPMWAKELTGDKIFFVFFSIHKFIKEFEGIRTQRMKTI